MILDNSYLSIRKLMAIVGFLLILLSIQSLNVTYNFSL